jgi:predicted nucleic acid-binding Zn ribbon protein
MNHTLHRTESVVIVSIFSINTTDRTQIMTNRKKKRTDWMLTRERFHIADPFPPPETRKERPIGSILPGILEQEQPNVSLPDDINEYWRIATGDQIAGHTAPEAIQNGILYVNVDHPGWLTEVRRLPGQAILKKLNQAQSLPEIRDIRFKLDPSIRTKGRWKKT